MRKCKFRLSVYVKSHKDGKRVKNKYVKSVWLHGYFHRFFQQGALDEMQGEIDCGMKVEDMKGHIHTIWNDADIKMMEPPRE